MDATQSLYKVARDPLAREIALQKREQAEGAGIDPFDVDAGLPRAPGLERGRPIQPRGAQQEFLLARRPATGRIARARRDRRTGRFEGGGRQAIPAVLPASTTRPDSTRTTRSAAASTSGRWLMRRMAGACPSAPSRLKNAVPSGSSR